MNCGNRHVCLSDLKDYLKRTDYLNNYTSVELAEIRKNIGAVSLKELDLLTSTIIEENKIIETTYEELLNLISENMLKISYFYVITDFQTIYASEYKIHDVPQSWGDEINPSKIYQIVSIAISNNALDPRVLILSEYKNSIKWDVRYDVTREILPDKTKTKGKITYLKDENNNCAFYDFKNIKFRRTKAQLDRIGYIIDSDYIDTYTFSTPDFKENSTNCHDNILNSGFNNNIFFDKCENNIFEVNFKNNTFIYSCIDNHFKSNTQNNGFGLPVKLLEGTFSDLTINNNVYLSENINKNIKKVNNAYILTYIDPETLTLQTEIL